MNKRVPIFLSFLIGVSGWPSLPKVGIIGGNEASPHSLPYQVFLKFISEDNTSWTCGGSLITTKYILTAARCAYGASSVEITLGAHNINTSEETQLKLESQDITIYQNFKKDVSAYVYENDIAVVSLSEPVTLTDSIQVVKLPSADVSEDTYINETCKISGWGQTDAYDSTSLSPVLLYQENVIISNKECTFVYYDLKDYDICMQTNEDESPCVGDFGSPLVVNDIQVGIASQSVMYCIPGYPLVYTRVSSFLDWIKDNTDYQDVGDIATVVEG